MRIHTARFPSFVRTAVLLLILTGWCSSTRAQAPHSPNRGEFRTQERNLMVDLSSGKAASHVVIDQLGGRDETRLLAILTIMNEHYWQDNAIVRAVTGRLVEWNDKCPEVYLAFAQKVGFVSQAPTAFASMWSGLQTTPLLLRDIAAGLMCNQPKARIEKTRQMLLTMEGQKSQDIIEEVASDATDLALRTFAQKRMLALLRSGGLNQKRIILLYLHANWPEAMDPQLHACLEELAEDSPVKSIALLAGRLLSEHAKK